MVKLYIKLDQAMLVGAQNSYLWLLDRTGIYAATVMFAVYAVGCGITLMGVVHPSGWLTSITLGFTLLIGLMTAPRYLMQDKGQIDRFNAMSLYMQGLWVRHAVGGVLLGSIVANVIQLDLANIASAGAMIAFNFYWVVMIRDRDKKPFFKLRESHEHLATDPA